MKRIQPSENGHFLMTSDQQPFFWLGDTAWEMLHRLTLAETELYLENRRRKGFNVIQAVAVAEISGLQVPTPANQVPFFDLDPTRPNDAYFDHVADVLRLAADKGLYVGLLPTWGDKVNQRWGDGPEIFNVETGYSYGQYIGRRLRDFDNLIWINGGDRLVFDNGIDYAPVWRSLAAGIRSEASQLMTFHPAGGHGSSEWFHEDEWLDLNMWQSGHADIGAATWEMISSDYARTPIKPTLDGEPCYEDIDIQFNPANGSFTAYDVRRRAYQSVFAGACGFTYGHQSVYQMYTPEHGSVLGAHMPWQVALDRPAAAQMIHLRDLMLSRPYFTRIPDQSMILNDPGTGAAHIRATRDADGRFAMVYLPKSDQTVRVDMQKFAGDSVQASWFDPRTGATTSIGSFAASGEAEFTTPHFQGPDCILLLDSIH